MVQFQSRLVHVVRRFFVAVSVACLDRADFADIITRVFGAKEINL